MIRCRRLVEIGAKVTVGQWNGAVQGVSLHTGLALTLRVPWIEHWKTISRNSLFVI